MVEHSAVHITAQRASPTLCLARTVLPVPVVQAAGVAGGVPGRVYGSRALRPVLPGQRVRQGGVGLARLALHGVDGCARASLRLQMGKNGDRFVKSKKRPLCGQHHACWYWAGLGAPTPGGPSLLRLRLLLLVGEPEAFQSGLFTTDCCLLVHRMGWAAAAPVAKMLQESKRPDWCCTFLLL